MAVFQIIVVDTHYNGGIDSVFGRRRQDDFLGAVFQVVAIAALAAFLRTEYTCRFYHHIGSLVPFDVQRSAFSSDGDAQAVDDECSIFRNNTGVQGNAINFQNDAYKNRFLRF